MITLQIQNKKSFVREAREFRKQFGNKFRISAVIFEKNMNLDFMWSYPTKESRMANKANNSFRKFLKQKGWEVN